MCKPYRVLGEIVDIGRPMPVGAVAEIECESAEFLLLHGAIEAVDESTAITFERSPYVVCAACSPPLTLVTVDGLRLSVPVALPPDAPVSLSPSRARANGITRTATRCACS